MDYRQEPWAHLSFLHFCLSLNVSFAVVLKICPQILWQFFPEKVDPHSLPTSVSGHRDPLLTNGMWQRDGWWLQSQDVTGVWLPPAIGWGSLALGQPCHRNIAPWIAHVGRRWSLLPRSMGESNAERILQPRSTCRWCRPSQHPYSPSGNTPSQFRSQKLWDSVFAVNALSVGY